MKSRLRLQLTFVHSIFILLQVLFLEISPASAGPLSCRDLLANPSRRSSEVLVDQVALKFFKQIYNDSSVALELAQFFEQLRLQTINRRPHQLIQDDVKSIQDPNRLMDQIQYMGYVESLGSTKGVGTFHNVTKMVDYLFDHLGATMIYPLPFLKSPFKDAGFDVADYKAVDPRFGGDEAFQDFKGALQGKNGQLQLDLVFNHTSMDHPWAKAALAGDLKYRNYFHILDHPPEVLTVRKNEDGKPMMARYRETDEEGRIKIVERRVIFPDFADPLHPHYTRLQDGNGKTIWVYHTFYPFQFDLNYTNPQVVRETLEIVGYWANQGVDVIRLDAIPFLFKNQESDPRTLGFVSTLRYFLAQVSPRTSLIVEACQEPAIVYKFFGQPENYHVRHLGMNMSTTTGAQIAYNFDLMGYAWASLLSGDKRYLQDIMAKTPEPPQRTVWANFLRLHDELTLEMVPDDVRSIIQTGLLSTGLGTSFRGDLGVGGRMANFLNRDPRKVKLGFSILLSLKGLPIIYYGDEIMTPSNKSYAERAAADRGGQYDARDEGRGPVDRTSYEQAMATSALTPEGTVLTNVRRLIEVRKQRESLRRGDTKIVETSHKSALAYLRSSSSPEETLIIHNLVDREIEAKITLKKIPRQLLDLIDKRTIPFKLTADGLLVLKLEPFQTLWLSI